MLIDMRSWSLRNSADALRCESVTISTDGTGAVTVLASAVLFFIAFIFILNIGKTADASCATSVRAVRLAIWNLWTAHTVIQNLAICTCSTCTRATLLKAFWDNNLT